MLAGPARLSHHKNLDRAQAPHGDADGKVAIDLADVGGEHFFNIAQGNAGQVERADLWDQDPAIAVNDQALA